MTDREDLVGAIVASRYRLQSLRPGGADTNSVFEALDTRDGGLVVVRLVAIHPVTDGESTAGEGDTTLPTESMKRQLLAVAGVSHPVLVTPLDWGETVLRDERFVFVVTEKLEGVSLRELLDRGRRLSASQAIVLALDLCRGLHHLHQLGIAHGDVRPANVFVSPNLRARLAGLGVKGSVGGAASLSIEQARYAAPEFAVDATASPEGDVYALALTVLETLTGEVPNAADSVAVTLSNRAGKLLPVSADIGPIAVPIEKAGRPIAADRATALQFGQSIAAVAAKLPSPEPLEALTSESFRDSITRTLEAVAVAPTPAPDSAPTPTTTPTSVDVAIAPAPGERRRYRFILGFGVAVALVVSGVLVWQRLTVDSFEVPNLVGVPEGEARNTVALFGWSIAIRAERSDEVALGAVIRTIPPAGTSLREGGDFTLVVSEGATLAVIPDVTGLARDDAVAALTAQGLTVAETVRDSDTVPIGRVLSWIVTEQPNLEPGSQVLKGTQVGIVVSGGPVLRAVPNLIGRTEADTLVQLTAVQLVGQRNDDVYSAEIAVGLVVSQDPAVGERLERNSIVAYSLSKGVELVELPAVVGLSLNDAQRLLGDLGIGVTVTGRSTSRVRAVTLDGITLQPGNPVPKGSTVNLVFP